MTLKQFLYLVVFIPLAYLIFAAFPIPLLNILLAVVCAGVGFAFAFYTIYDRPLDVWLKNLLRRLNAPTQFFYHKQENVLPFLRNLYFVTDPHHIVAHIEAQEKLAAYLAKTNPKKPASPQHKQNVQSLLKTPMAQLKPATPVQPAQPPAVVQSPVPVSAPAPTPAPVPVPAPVSAPVQPVPLQPAAEPAPTVSTPVPVASPRQPFFLGTIKNNRKIPLPGILVYMKDANNAPLRLLKTNPHGVFATYNSLPAGEYQVEVKDPNGSYFFDTMKVQINATNPAPIEIYSKEIL